MFNSSYFLCTLFKVWLETSCTVARSLCGPQLLSTRHFRQCLSACSLVNLPLKTLLLPSLVPLLLRISHFTSLPWCGARAVGSPICHQPFFPAQSTSRTHGHQSCTGERCSTVPATKRVNSVPAKTRTVVHLLGVQGRDPGLMTMRARNFLSKRAGVFHIVLSSHGGGRT